ncbi:MAG: S9 family peptidase [Chloroflexota bacterium]|nr:S9 family peptidase [Chloroflexota bacterium]
MPTPLTEELIVSLAYPDDPQLSPDGSRVAYVAACYGQEGDHSEGTIWVAPTDGTAMARQWTFGGGRDDTPRWSPDGHTLAFLSDRATRGTKALYRMPANGGEAEKLVERKQSIEFFAWSPDGRRVAFLAPDDPTDADERREKERDDADVYGERWPYHRLHLLDLASGAVTVLPTGDMHITECAWSPDGQTIAYFAQPTPELDDRHKTAIFTIPVVSGQAHRLCHTTGGSNLAWGISEAVGDLLVFVAPHEPAPQCSATIWAVSAEGGEPTVMNPAVTEAACAMHLAIAPGQPRMTIALARGLTTELVNLNTPTGLPTPFCAHPTGDLGAFSGAMPTHTAPVVAVVRSAGDEPPELWAGAPHALHRISDHHAEFRDIQFGKQEPFYWDAPDGLALDGILIRPPDAPDGPLPTIVYVHGGPYSRWANGWNLRPNNWGQWLATHGYAVLMPNCRGGMGHGNTFATAARGDVGGADYRDIMAAVDAAIARGIADPERLGIGGWSQGGFMTAWAITQTHRFKAGVMGAGIADWNMMTMTSDLPTFEAALGGDRPWDGPGPHNAARLSPISYAKNAITPLLMLHGKNDARVPLTQAIGFARALREHDVPVQFVTYPREPHGVRERAHQRDILRRVRAWYDQWLKPGGEST